MKLFAAKKNRQQRRQLDPIRITALGFAVMILLGALLLLLPAANKDGTTVPFVNALFTATSATCVTGLIVYDTYTQFTLFGQAVILTLIQIGGLGFMTVGTLLMLVTHRHIGLAGRNLLTESVSAFQIGGIVRLVRRIIIGTAIIETIGAAMLAIRFCPLLGVKTGLYYAFFHSISAFCNAGFDIMGRFTSYTSLTPFRGDVIVNLTIAALIVIGGIGFVVWDDLREHKLRWRKYRLHTKIVITATISLIVGGAIAFFLLERTRTLSGLPVGQQILASIFQSVSPRTAGFNTVEMGELSEGGSALTMLLMFIGASPGSTGGGLKTTTLATIIMTTVAYIRGTSDVNIFRRRLPTDTVRRAFSFTTIYLALILFGIFALTAAQPLPLKDVAFEVFSALGTVGLTTGITRALGTFSRIIITLLMYIGRVGSLTLIFAVLRSDDAGLRNPEEKIIIG